MRFKRSLPKNRGLILLLAAALVAAPAAVMAQPGQAAQLSQSQLRQLVAPIALYPDSLVAQILAAAAYPTQIVEAERFVEQNSGLTGEALANAVEGQDWPPSVKALTAFPEVLSDMSQDLSWTAELGDAYQSRAGDVMNAIQDLRRQAEQAGNLQDTPQQTVTNQNGNIDIDPANPDIVYVPEYDPESIYGYSIGLWPGLSPWWTVSGPFIAFGAGVPLMPWMGWGWGWRHWRLGWGAHPRVWFGGREWRSEPRGFYNQRAFEHGRYRGFAGRGEHGREYGAGRPGMPRGRAEPGYGAVSRPGMPRQGFNRGAGMPHGARPQRFGGASRGQARGFGGRGRAGGGEAHGFRGGGHGGEARGGEEHGGGGHH